MSYRSGGYKSPFIGVGALIGILVVGGFAMRAQTIIGSLAGAGTLTTSEGVERELFRSAETGPVYRTLKRTYPQEFDALTADVVRRAKAGETHDQIEDAILTDMIEAGKRHRKDMIQTPHDRFADYRGAEIGVVSMLRDRDPQLCATYVMNGAVRSQSQRLDPAKFIAMRIAVLEAGAAGRDHPVNRTVAMPGPADLQLIRSRMMADGIGQSGIDAFFSQAGLTKSPPLEQCAIGLSFYRAVDQLPGDKADQFYAWLISRDG